MTSVNEQLHHNKDDCCCSADPLDRIEIEYDTLSLQGRQEGLEEEWGGSCSIRRVFIRTSLTRPEKQGGRQGVQIGSSVIDLTLTQCLTRNCTPWGKCILTAG